MINGRHCAAGTALIFWLAIGFSCPGGAAQKAAAAPEKAVAPVDAPEKRVLTSHAMRIDGQKYNYTATAGELQIERGEGEAAVSAMMFYVAYTLEADKPAQRPVTFLFNGGPGAASVWLHLGGLGPKRIEFSENGQALPPPVRYRDNPHTWLAFTDLVFVDPVGTGFSRSEASADAVERGFLGVKQDIAAAADFIRLYLTRSQRWLSPKYLVGESYGTTRVAGLAWHLNQRYGINLNGVVLVSPVLDFHTILFHPANDLPYALFLPTYAAAAHYHGRLSPALQKQDITALLPKVEAFCLTEYTAFLILGEAAGALHKKSIAERLQAYTGLPPDLIEKNHYRIDWVDFTMRLLADERRIVGRMDSTITGVNPAPAEVYPKYDPSLDTLYGPFAAAMNAYVRGELGFETDHTYEFLNADINRRWDWVTGLPQHQGFVRVAHDLRDALALNQNLKVLIACGRYDLATPYFSAAYTLDHMWLGSRRADIDIRCYRAGHMLFTHAQALAEFTRDAKRFFAR